MARLAHLHIENFCCIEKASIPLSNRGLVLITGDNQDTNAATNNGAGKSSILKALTFALFAETLDGDKYDEVIRWNQKQAEVSVAFYVGEQMWIVRRWRTKGSPGLSLASVEVSKRGRSKDIVEKDWQGSSKEIQAKIIDLIGMDFRAFCNTTLFGEGDRGRFFSAADTARKETLHRILRSDIYRKAEKHLKEREIRALRIEVDTLSAEVATLRARVEEHDLQRLEAQVEQWEERQEKAIKEALTAVRSNTTEAKMVDAETKARREELEKALAASEAQARELSKLDRQTREAENSARESEVKVAGLQADVEELDRRIDGLVDKLELFVQDRCPECSSPLDKGAPAILKVRLLTEKQRLSDQVEPKRVQLQLVTRARDERSTKAAELARKRMTALSETVSDPSGIRSELKLLAGHAVERVRWFKGWAQQSLDLAKKLQGEENPHEAELKLARDRLSDLKRQLAEREAALKEKRVELAHYEFWVRGFGSQGLPSLLLDSTMSYISSRTNEYLETLTDGDITVMFSTQRELKGGGKKDEIQSAIIIEGVPGATPSKGQKRKLDLAADLALMDLAESREGDIGLMMIDEVLDGLDAEGVSRVLRLLHDLRTKRPTIFVVTHEAGLAEAFERELRVTKQNQAATITEVS